MIKKEIFWLCGTTLFVLILYTVVLGIDGIKANSTLDTKIHDTYLVVANTHLFLILAILVFFGVYLIRTIKYRFKNLTTNLVFMISAIGLILVLMEINAITNTLNQQMSSWTIYPPFSAIEVESKEKTFSFLSSSLYFTQFVLLIFLAFCGFKTGQHYNRDESKAKHTILFIF